MDKKGSCSVYLMQKLEKISPDGKAKVQLQLVLHSGEAVTLHFAGDGDSAKKDRDGVKELLQQLLPRFRNQANRQLEEKNRMLQDDPVLFDLYKELVVGKVISADEFWSNRTSEPGAGAVVPGAKQNVGVSAAFLADVKPQADGCNGLRYNLTADIIESVFRTYPAVRQKYTEHVPGLLSEAEFWTQFFQSHYFHRDRTATSTQDIFSECAQQDNKELLNVIGQDVVKPQLDLNNMDDAALEEGYGIAGLPASAGSRGSRESSNSAIIRRFNHHSAMVLSAGRPDRQTSGENGEEPNGADETQAPSKRVCPATSAGDYVDLEETVQSCAVSLNLMKADRYHHGPVPLLSQHYCTGDEIMAAISALHQEMAEYRPRLAQALTSKAAGQAIAALSPGGSMMQEVGQIPADLLAGPTERQELRQLYLGLSELLRHFWACFPISSLALQDKVIRMKGNLERFETTKIKVFEDKLAKSQQNGNLTNHLREMLTVAYRKFHTWQAKQSAKSS
uniref:general transcription factor IIH subunit 1 isoform X2 n=1 Tax=Myxine glutinosa TaxID=7769 RepID=UPI00358F7DAD